MGTDAPDAVIDRFFTAIATGDRETIAELYADDVEVWHSATNRAADRATALAILDWLLLAPGVTMDYELVEQLMIGERVCRRHVLTVGVPGHEPVVMPVAIFFTIRDGLIRRIEEYVDAKGTDRLIEIVPAPRPAPAHAPAT
jgi:ketosteroid isomerase-like protein